jgi:hypothetical protein
VSCTKRFFQKCRTTRGESRLWQVGVRVGVRVGVERAVGVVALSVGLVCAAGCFSSVSEARLWRVRVRVERAVGVVSLLRLY